MTAILVSADRAPRFGRQTLSLWSGRFASDWEGEATELPQGGGYLVRLSYARGRVRVLCPSPRTEENYREVDAAICAAVDAYLERSA